MLSVPCCTLRLARQSGSCCLLKEKRNRSCTCRAPARPVLHSTSRVRSTTNCDTHVLIVASKHDTTLELRTASLAAGSGRALGDYPMRLCVCSASTSPAQTANFITILYRDRDGTAARFGSRVCLPRTFCRARRGHSRAASLSPSTGAARSDERAW